LARGKAGTSRVDAVKEGTTLKHYELLSRLGEGGMGVVYRARDTRLGRTVALKILPADVAGDDERRRRFEREARLASAISHPGVATVYDFDQDGEVTFLTMELVKGRNLRELLQEGEIPMRRILECALQVAEAMAAAHREGVIHRDLKPENIVASDSGYFKVLDFGVARREAMTGPQEATATLLETLQQSTKEGALIGTVSYMSPEQIQGLPVETRSDIFSFGSLLYELISGEPPFRRNNDIATAHAIVYDPHDPLRVGRPEVSAGLEQVVGKCLAKSPDDRYQDAADLVEDLRTLHFSSLSGTRSGKRLIAAIGSPRRTGRWIAWGALALVVVLAGTLVAWQWSRKTGPGPGTSAPAVDLAGATPASAEARPRILVAPFENNTGDAEIDWLTRGLPEMLTTGLSRSEQLEVIATRHLDDLLALSGQGEAAKLDRSTATELARWAGANIVISGSIFKIGERYRIDAQGYDTATGTVSVAHKVEGGELLRLVDDLTAGVLRGLSVTPGKRGKMGMATTSSEDAFRLYVRGKSSLENLMFEDAARQFEDSLEADPEFALGRLRLAMSRLLAGETETAVEELEVAVRQADRMPNQDRLLALGLHAIFAENDLESGLGHLDDLARRYPRDKEAPVWRARAYVTLAGDQLEATRALRGAIQQDPNNLAAVAAMAEQLSGLGETEAAGAILREAARRNPAAQASLERLIARLAPPAGGASPRSE
jgi:TolB-like protein/predicted Ser/Thr protein kinase/Tfp pilus assembly protein PilF